MQNAFYVIKVKPFRIRLFQYLNCLNEVIVVAVYTIAFGMLEMSRETRDGAGYGAVILILLMILINLGLAFFKSIQSLCELIRKKRKAAVNPETHDLTIHSEEAQPKQAVQCKCKNTERCVGRVWLWVLGLWLFP